MGSTPSGIPYDNSELLKNYVHAYHATGSEFFKTVARDIIRWTDEWLSDRQHGGFYASQDADISLDDDGDYFTWTVDEAKAVLMARSVIEESARKAGQAAPQILHFYPKAIADGWDVHVEYVAFWANGKPSSGPGLFADVLIGRNWKVIKVIGGA